MTEYDDTRYKRTIRQWSCPDREALERITFMAIGHPRVRVTVETWEIAEQTHGPVEEEMLQNGYFRCDCGKMHAMFSGKDCPACGAAFPRQYTKTSCRSTP